MFEPKVPEAPEASRLAANVSGDLLGEDKDEEEAPDAADDDSDGDNDEAVRLALENAEAVEEVSGGAAATAAVLGGSPVAASQSAAQSSQPRPESEAIDEEPHLHFRYRAGWGSVEKNPIASAADSRRNKALYTVNKDKV